jgi:hypothetical protein
MRHISNLQQDTQFKLERQELSQGFYGFYRSKYSGKGGIKPLEFMIQAFAMLMCQGISGRAMDQKSFPKLLKEQVLSGRTIVANSSLFKVAAQKKFVLRAYTLNFDKATLASTLDMFAGIYRLSDPSFTEDAYSKAMGGDHSIGFVAKQNWQTVFSGDQLAARLNINQRGRDIIRTAVDRASLEQVGSKLTLVIDFNISFKEAEFLSQSPIQEISLANLYSFLMLWVGSNFASVPGASVAPYSVPITKIAERVTLELKDKSKTLTKRVDSDSLLVDHLGTILYIPDINNAQSYVQKLTAFGTQPDGSFSYKNSLPTSADGDVNFKVNDPSSQRKKLPANIPLFTDWVNRKFAFVNSSGNVDVLDLGSCTPLSAFNITTMLRIAVGKENPVSPIGYALFIAEATQPGFMKSNPPRPDEMDPALWSKLSSEAAITTPTFLNALVNTVGRYRVANGLDTSGLEGGPEKWETSLDIFNKNSPITEFRFIGRLIDAAKILLLENLEAAFSKYSVTTVLAVVATTFVFSRHADKYAQVSEADKSLRQDYLEQGIDESYVALPLPNFRKDVAFMPHQAKAANKLRKGPKFAILEIDAGGGKTLQILSNILKELKDRHCVRPIIACPSHLVSSYVKEAVYFTEGKVNVVPLTSVALKQHGEERLSEIVRKAPINTIFLTDFNFIKNKSIEVAYGNTQVVVYRNAEFLRKFEFDLICIDECHYLRAPSMRTKAVSAFMTEIPMKRLASGTFIADTIADVAPQFALLDPTVFGTREQFIKTYAGEMRGEKVMAWKPGAESMIRQKMAEHCVMVNHKRKEWAALLPMPQEEFFGVELTDNQRALYETILRQTLDLLREAIANDPELKEALESDDDSKTELLQLKLSRYLARLEAFLSSPESDVAGKEFLLLPEDKVSPKVKKIYERIRHHTESKIPGKILIFTNYLRAAHSVYDNAPPDIKKRMIHYTAETKAECKTAFETLPEKDIMVGVETSMNTGLNLQFCSRLIRMETVWTPGVLEQGNARVNRPNVKKKETRQFIYFDWIVINKTIDVSKISRLISKMVSKAKFDEWENPQYQAIPDVPQIAMTMDTIGSHNDFEGSLLPYLETYEKYKQVQMADYKDYKARNQGKLDPVPIAAEGILPGSKLMTRVPYVPDMEIYGENDLGLIRYDQFIHQDASSLDEDDDESESESDADEADDPKNAALQEERAVMKGQPVHTEWGDGVITGLGRKRVRVMFSDGTRKSVNKLAAYVITRSSTNSKDMRAELLKTVGALPLTEPFDVPVEEGVSNKKRRAGKPEIVEQEEVETPSASFDITVVNDYLALSYRTVGQGDKMVARLANVGFIKSPDYYYSILVGPKNLLKLFADWKAAGFRVDPKTSLTFQHVHQALQGNKTAGNRFGFATELDLRNWLRSTIKPTADPKIIHPYPIVQDDQLYIALPIQGQAGTRGAIKIQPGKIRWRLGGEDEVLRFVTKTSEIIQVLKQVQGEGIKIDNLDELKEQYERFKMVKPRSDL